MKRVPHALDGVHPRRRARVPTILVVDDDVTYGGALRQLLEADGHPVHQVLDGEEALRRVAALGDDLGLILLDLLLPRRSGFEVVKELSDAGCRVPVLCMTGLYDDAREIRALRALGVAGWLHKSAPLDHVLYRVHGLLHPERLNTRVARRVAASVPAEFRLEGGEPRYGTSYNVSESGVYVRTAEPPETGARVELALSLPTAREPLALVGEVVHAATAGEVEGTGYPAGFGLRFERSTPLVVAALRRFVDAIALEEATGAPTGDAARAGSACADPGTDDDGETKQSESEPVPAQICS